MEEVKSPLTSEKSVIYLLTFPIGIYVSNGAFVEEDNAYSVVNSNHADQNGGGIFIEPNSTFVWNTGMWCQAFFFCLEDD